MPNAKILMSNHDPKGTPNPNTKNGVSLVIVFLIMAMCLSVVLGISTILSGEARRISDAGNSVQAIYVGDSGVEKTLYYDKSSSIIPTGAARGICYSAMSNCFLLTSGTCTRLPLDIGLTGCNSCTDCKISFTGSLPNVSNPFIMTVVISSASTATDSFFQSTGTYNRTSRLIELDILK